MTKQQLADEYARQHLCATCQWKTGSLCTMPRCMKLKEVKNSDGK